VLGILRDCNRIVLGGERPPLLIKYLPSPSACQIFITELEGLFDLTAEELFVKMNTVGGESEHLVKWRTMPVDKI
jgi:hypothetical protein